MQLSSGVEYNNFQHQLKNKQTIGSYTKLNHPAPKTRQSRKCQSKLEHQHVIYKLQK